MTGNTVNVTDATPTALLDEIRVDAGLGTGAAHAVLPGPGGAS